MLMMNFLPRFPSIFHARLLACTVLLASLVLPVHAAELGEPIVRSYKGQPLVADIELSTLSDPSQAVVVRLANPDVFKGANIGMNPVLANLTMSVMRRDGRQFLHITSTKAVESEYVHIFLDLADGGRRQVRLATLWLTPDPTPAPPPPPPKPAVVAPPIPVVIPAPAPVPAPVPTRVITAPPAACPKPAAPAVAAPAACASTEYQNGLLSAQIVELEEKVRALEQAMHQNGNALPAPAVAAVPPKPKAAAPAVPPRPSVRKKVEEPFPWLIVGGALGLVLLLAVAGLLLLRRRRKRALAGVVSEVAPDKVAWYKALGARLRRKPKPVAEAPVEPVIEA
jgi:LPXTG-motif cell wall-anchored protein